MPNDNFAPLKQLMSRGERSTKMLQWKKYLGKCGSTRNLQPKLILSIGELHADLIERRFGKSRLIDCVGEPIQFLETYN